MKPFKKPSQAEIAKISEVAGTFSAAAAKVEPAQVTSIRRYSVGSSYDVPVSEIKVNPYNARRLISQDGLDELALSISKRQDTPAIAYLDETGAICLVDGHRRLEACRIASKESLRVEIQQKPVSNKDLYLASRRANVERKDQTPLDDAIAWRILLEEGVYKTQLEIATDLGIDETVFSRVFNLGVLPKTIVRILADRPNLLTLRMLDAIRKYWEAAGDEQTEILILDIDNNDISSREVDARRQALSKVKTKRVRAISVPMKYPKGSALLKNFSEKGKIQLEIKDIKDKELIEKIAERLNEITKELLSA